MQLDNLMDLYHSLKPFIGRTNCIQLANIQIKHGKANNVHLKMYNSIKHQKIVGFSHIRDL